MPKSNGRPAGSYRWILRRVFVIANLLLAKANLRLERVAAPNSLPSVFRQSPSCQIANLNHLYESVFGNVSDGIFVEVGAYDGYTYSNSWGLAEKGWHGVLVEPVPHFAQQCRDLYKANAKITVVDMAVGEGPGQIDLRIAGPLTSANKNLLDEYESVAWAQKDLTKEVVRVQCNSLDFILRNQRMEGPIDVLIVDVEGNEENVMKGFSLNQWQPRMLIIELCDTHPDIQATRLSDRRLNLSLQSSGYEILYKDAINTVFVKKQAISNREMNLDRATSADVTF